MHVTSAANQPLPLLAHMRPHQAVQAGQHHNRPEAGTHSAGAPAESDPRSLRADQRVFLKNFVKAHVQGPQAGEGQEKTPLQKLIADWGKTDSPFDLNGDGKVGVKDLLRMLAKMGLPSGPHQVPSPLPAPPMPEVDTGTGPVADTDAPEPTPLQQLLEAWGQSDSEWDLDGDGVVGTGDLLALLQKMGSAGDGVTDPAIEPTLPVPPGAQVETPPVRSPLEELLAAWGQTDSIYDLDGDGVVGTGDLLAMLQQMGSPDAGATADAPAGLADMPLHAPTTRAAFDHLAQSLMQRFDPSAPGAIFSAVEDSALGAEHKQFLLGRLAALAPRGLQVSTVG